MRKVEVICVWSSYTQNVHSITVLTHPKGASHHIELVDCLHKKPRSIDELHSAIQAILKANDFYTDCFQIFNSKFHDIYFIDLDDCSHKPSRYGVS